MVIIEMRQAAKDKAFDLLNEIKDLGRKKKMAICELEETLYDCFESSDEDEYKESEEEYDGEDKDMEFRRNRSYRYGRRHSMRYDDEDMDDMHPSYRRHGMRRDRMGRFV